MIINNIQNILHAMLYSQTRAVGPEGRLNIKIPSYQYKDLMLKIRRLCDRPLIFNMGTPYLERRSLYGNGAQPTDWVTI